MMIEPCEARYQWGQAVVALEDLLNDGSHPEHAPDAVIVETGSEGRIVQIGHHESSNQPVYMVEFGERVVGCMEEEIMLLAELHEMIDEARGASSRPAVQGSVAP